MYIKPAGSYKNELIIEDLNKIALLLEVILKGLLMQKKGLSKWEKLFHSF
jgi:hypothetical protein